MAGATVYPGALDNFAESSPTNPGATIRNNYSLGTAGNGGGAGIAGAVVIQYQIG